MDHVRVALGGDPTRRMIPIAGENKQRRRGGATGRSRVEMMARYVCLRESVDRCLTTHEWNRNSDMLQRVILTCVRLVRVYEHW